MPTWQEQQYTEQIEPLKEYFRSCSLLDEAAKIALVNVVEGLRLHGGDVQELIQHAQDVSIILDFYVSKYEIEHERAKFELEKLYANLLMGVKASTHSKLLKDELHGIVINNGVYLAQYAETQVLAELNSHLQKLYRRSFDKIRLVEHYSNNARAQLKFDTVVD